MEYFKTIQKHWQAIPLKKRYLYYYIGCTLAEIAMAGFCRNISYVAESFFGYLLLTCMLFALRRVAITQDIIAFIRDSNPALFHKIFGHTSNDYLPTYLFMTTKVMEILDEKTLQLYREYKLCFRYFILSLITFIGIMTTYLVLKYR